MVVALSLNAPLPSSCDSSTATGDGSESSEDDPRGRARPASRDSSCTMIHTRIHDNDATHHRLRSRPHPDAPDSRCPSRFSAPCIRGRARPNSDEQRTNERSAQRVSLRGRSTSSSDTAIASYFQPCRLVRDHERRSSLKTVRYKTSERV